MQIAHNCNIIDNNIHSIDSFERHKEFLTYTNIGLQKIFDLKESEIIIGNDVWIGANCTILKGVKIGENSIIGAGSVVVKNIEKNVLAVGNPAIVIKMLK